MKLRLDKGKIKVIIIVFAILILLLGLVITYLTKLKRQDNPTTPVYSNVNIENDDDEEGEELTYPKINKVKKDISQFIKSEKTIDWVYDPSTYINSSNSRSLFSNTSTSYGAMDSTGAASSSGKTSIFSDFKSNSSASMSQSIEESDSMLGFSVGGAKNSTSYRKNIENNYFPLETDITYEGIYYDYYFDTGKATSTNDGEMFYPSYSKAVSNDPISGEEEYFLSVGLNSNIKETDFKREKLNLVLVLDISGSMSSRLNRYYYDAKSNSNKDEDVNEDDEKTKMQLANEALTMTLDTLQEYDNVGIILFDNVAYKAKDMDLMINTDIDGLKEKILTIEARGGTNFDDGYTAATEMIKGNELFNVEGFTNRIIVITDAMPNIGKTTKQGLKKAMYENAQAGIYTSFVGVGVDFNTKLVKNITDIRGANYYSISETAEFKKILADEFDFMVTPLVYDLDVSLSSDTYEIEAVYGTDSIDSEKANIMHVNTLFPSASDSSGDVKGGLVVLQLKKKSDAKDGNIDVIVSYETIDGDKKENKASVDYNTDEKEFYDNNGIRKGIALARYVSTIKDWIAYERDEKAEFKVTNKCGIIPWRTPSLGENERQSVQLKVGKEYKDVFKRLKEYLIVEMKATNDNTLQQEIDILDKLI